MLPSDDYASFQSFYNQFCHNNDKTDLNKNGMRAVELKQQFTLAI